MVLVHWPWVQEGHWADVSGETFLRKLLGSPLEMTKFDFNGRPEMFSCAAPIGVDPRQIAQRIMEIRWGAAQHISAHFSTATE